VASIKLEIGSQLFAHKPLQVCISLADLMGVLSSQLLSTLLLVIPKSRVLQIVLDHRVNCPELSDAVSELNAFSHCQKGHIFAFSNELQTVQMDCPNDILLYLGLLEKNVFY